jgi:hypothetical protein
MKWFCSKLIAATKIIDDDDDLISTSSIGLLMALGIIRI